MTSQNTQIEALEALAQNEEILSKLYSVFQERFPRFKDFWEDLVKDELTHAELVRELIPLLKKGDLFFETDRFNKDAIQEFSKYVAEEIENVSKEKIPLKEALSIALNAEESLIEKGYFEVFEIDSLPVEQTLLNLKLATQEHIKEIEKVLDENK